MGTLDGTGYTPRLVDEIVQELNDDVHANIDPGLDVQAESFLGQVFGIVGAAIAEAEANQLAVYRSAFVDAAEGESLEALCRLTAVTRVPATPSLVVLSLTGTAGTVIAAGRIVSAPTNGTRWVTNTAVTLDGGGHGTAQAACLVTGPTAANAGTVTRIETPVAGWASVTNAADALPGTNLESDAELRLRRQLLLFSEGKGTNNAILDAVLRVQGVTQARVFENDTGATVDGVPSRSFEVVVSGGTAQVLRDAIFAVKGSGITAYGTTTGTSTDSEGFTHAVGFSRPTPKALAVNVLVEVDPGRYAGDTAMSLAVRNYINALGLGQKVVYSKLEALVADQAGVTDVISLDVMYQGDPPPLAPANLPIAPREVANLQAADTSVTSR